MQRHTKGWLGLLVSAGMLVLAAPVLADPPPHAKAWGYRNHDVRSERSDQHEHYRDDDARYRSDYRDRYRDDDHYDRYGHRYGDRRCNHDRDYRASRDYRDYRDYSDNRDYREIRNDRVVPRLPRGYRTVNYRGDRYYYAGGNWYRPYGQQFVSVRPPADLFAKAFPVRGF